MIRSLARKILNRAGFDTVLVSSSEEALSVLENRSESCHLVITDYIMEGLSGVDLACAIRSLAPAVPVIMSSGTRIDPEDIPVDLQFNTHVLQKPYRSQELVDLVQAALDGA